ncbi:GDSL esterase/lipase At1g29670-like [Andrographis paniculata]|uniref:GDSL esterase/lipase At1g29670-like n=1 Tax=Andrographis paniculata TaxID=175694 RepID=UPI0021E935FD|nr:GDSL esterase/lipase At1g29670-like [Andrographis paniculata]
MRPTAVALGSAAAAVRTQIVFVLVVVVIGSSSAVRAAGQEQQQVRCFFIFGDSLVDNGNNNNLRTMTKVNYQPYGIDFPHARPTGRFTNGRNLADFIAEHLGFKTPIPPNASVQDHNPDIILTGVNYASGSAGIRAETGEHLGDRIFLDKQLEHHRGRVSEVTKLVGNESAARAHLRECLYYFNVGSNDYINNYFLPHHYNTSALYSPPEYAAELIHQFSRQLGELYHLGSRKVAVSALHALGCIPEMMSGGLNCNESMNQAVALFNRKLRVLVRELNGKYADAEYAVIPEDALNPPGFLATPCCKVSKSTGLCLHGEEGEVCGSRLLHVFFDNFHPTEIVNKLLGIVAYNRILLLLHHH